MDESSQHKKRKLADQTDASKSMEIASKLIESGDSAQLREMLANAGLSEINMDNGTGERLLVLASHARKLGCLRVLLDYLESSATELVNQTNEQSRVNESELLAYRNSFDVKKSSVLVACRGPSQFDDNFWRYGVVEIAPDELSVDCVYEHGVNVLVELCQCCDGSVKNFEFIKELIRAGVDVNGFDSSQRCAIVNACLYNNADVVELLLEHGAYVNTCYPIGFYGAQPACCNDFIGYPLHLVCSTSYGSLSLPIMRLLLKHGADVDVIDEEGYTPLMRLFQNFMNFKWKVVEEAIKLVLTYGADVSIKGKDGKSVFDYVEAGSEIEAFLKECADRKSLLK